MIKLLIFQCFAVPYCKGQKLVPLVQITSLQKFRCIGTINYPLFYYGAANLMVLDLCERSVRYIISTNKENIKTGIWYAFVTKHAVLYE
jgi:hypothetical protein